MIDATVPLQTLLYDTLTNDSSLSAVVTGVFDTVPDEQPTPFITIGDISSLDYSTHGIPGQEHTVTIHVWDEGESRLVSKQIAGIVIGALHDKDLTFTGSPVHHRLLNIRWEFTDVFKDPDGRTWHGVVRFRVVTDQISN